MLRITTARLAGVVAVCLAAIAVQLPVASSGHAQTVVGEDPGSAVRTRAELERLLEEYEQALASPAYSESVKRGISADAQAIRRRLEDGDFRIGDRIVIYVQGEPDLPDTLVVQSGPRVALPLFGDIPLDGVLRSEVQPHLTEALSRFIREPVVRAEGLMRLAVIGQVSRPGFYTFPAETLLGDALMLAGGPTQASNLEEIRIERGTVRLLEGEELQEAMRSGLTLDQLNLQAGDQIVVPERPTGGAFLRVLAIVGTVGSTIFLVTRIFN